MVRRFKKKKKKGNAALRAKQARPEEVASH